MATPVSYFVKTVCLKDWWLTKAENSGSSRVAVAGIESKGRQAARVFFSAPIVKRHDLFTLKTADGIFVLLKGPINKEQTCESGFSKEVFKHFLFGFPSDWEISAEKCFEQGTGSEATSDADIYPELNAATEMGNAKLRQPFRKDLGSIDRPENLIDGGEEVDIQLQDDQNIRSAEERSLEGSGYHVEDHNKEIHATVCGHDENTCNNTGCHDSYVGCKEEGVRYHLRNREVSHSEAIGVYNGKHMKNIAEGGSFLKNTTIVADNSMQNIRDENENMPMTPDCIGSRRLETQRQHANEDTTPTEENFNYTSQDEGQLKNSNSYHSDGSKSHQSKKRKRNQRKTAKATAKDASYAKNINRTRSLLKKTGGNTDSSSRTEVMLENSTKSGVEAADGTIKHSQNGSAEYKNTRGHLRSARRNVQKRIREDDRLLEVFSLQDADKLEASMPRRFCSRKSHESKKERNQRSILTRTTADGKNCHDFARSASRTGTSKVKNIPKTAVTKRERNARKGSTPKTQTRRRLDYAEQTTPISEGKKKGPEDFSESSVLKTSRSGRLLLPTMEYWRNQLPIYDADHGISGIRDGSTVLKFQRGRKSKGRT